MEKKKTERGLEEDEGGGRMEGRKLKWWERHKSEDDSWKRSVGVPSRKLQAPK